MADTTLLLTPEEVGVELRISVRSVERMIQAGELKGIRIGAGRRMRVRRSDLEAWVKRQQTTAEQGADMWRAS